MPESSTSVLPAERRDASGPLAVHLVTLGCARNEVDSEELAARLEDGGFRLVAEPEDADAVMVNTCGFVEAAKKDSVDTLLAAADLKADGRPQAVVAVGCLAERYGNELAEALPEADAVLGFDDYADVAEPAAGDPRRRAPSGPRAPRPPHAAAAGAGRAPAGRGRRGHPGSRLVGGSRRPRAPASGPRSLPAPAGRRPVGAAQDRLRLRPALHLLRDPGLPRRVRVPHRRPRWWPRPAGWPSRASARCSWSARTPPPTARTSATSGCSKKLLGRAGGSRRAGLGPGVLPAAGRDAARAWWRP